MKKLLLLFVLLSAGLFSHADHITGGEMFYTLVSFTNNQYNYKVTAKFFKDCSINRQFQAVTQLAVYEKTTGKNITTISAPMTGTENLNMINNNPCITNPPQVCYDVAYYETDLSLPASIHGYVLATQVNYRINSINNMEAGYGNIGATYTAEIPANRPVPLAQENNSARFTGSDLVVVCANNSFSYSFGATDADGDELRYAFCQAYQSSGFGGGANTPPPPAPPYNSVPYGGSYSGSNPLGNNVRIDSKTGLITGIAPTGGTYVVTVCVDELRNGVVIAQQRKDLQIKITSCTIAAATILPEYQLCKETFSLEVANLAFSPLIKSYNWSLTDNKGQTIHTSTNTLLNYTFSDTGLYHIKLIINQNELCSDSSTAIARVYPGFKPDFTNLGSCISNAISFSDNTTTVYGRVNTWNWNFGEGIATNNTSNRQNPSYRFTSIGRKNVTLVAGNTLGCSDTLVKAIPILDKPPIELLFKDTLICTPDPVQLVAKGNGQFTWRPTGGIQASTSAQPIVSPTQTTTYIVNLNEDGCQNEDSVRVRVVNAVSLQAMPDTVVCAGDAITLRSTSNGLQYNWLPALNVSSPTNRQTIARTATTTTYTLTARIGSCVATDEVVVTAVPYPAANAGLDTVICHKAAVQLNGEVNGNSFSWSPAASLNSVSSLTPVARPSATTSYILTTFDTRGCPKPGHDTVVVAVLPPINAFAGRDTVVTVGQSLQLEASGGLAYQWLPAEDLTASNIANPVAQFSFPTEGKRLKVRVFNEANCVDSAFITIKVFETAPTIFVPTAFTPNGDGRNDILKPIAVGMQTLEYFNIYNRWGQLVYSSQQPAQGWNGYIGGQLQGSGTYVWVVKAVDFTGKSYFQKGMVTLIR